MLSQAQSRKWKTRCLLEANFQVKTAGIFLALVALLQPFCMCLNVIENAKLK